MLVDAHIHFANLYERDPEFPGRFASSGIDACAASHSRDEFQWTQSLRATGIDFKTSFGIHPQWPVMDNADFLAGLARNARIDVIGEAGFDFFGDRPEFSRTPENLAVQRRAFEFQLELARETGLPLLVHARKAMDLMFEYTRPLSRLRAVIFHSWPGTPGEATALLGRGIPAFFSFGAIVMNGHKRAVASLVAVPASTILSETDAPWQAPRGGEFCRFEDLGRIVETMAKLRGTDVETMKDSIAANWARLFGKAP